MARIAPIGFRSLLLAMGLVVSLHAQMTLLPNPAPADTSFRLYVLGQAVCRDCLHSFIADSVAVNGSRIDLRAVVASPIVPLVTEVPAGPLAIVAGQVPVFTLPPLRSGRYEVWITTLPECLVLKACTIPERLPVSAGSLQVKAGVSATHLLNPASAPAAKPLDLQVLSGGYSCATAYDSLSTEISGDLITLTFHDYERPMGCGIVYEIAGPTFQLPALEAGTYRVRVNRLSKRSVFEAGLLEILGTAALAPGSEGNRPVAAGRVGIGKSARGSAVQVIRRGHAVDLAGRRLLPAQALERPKPAP